MVVEKVAGKSIILVDSQKVYRDAFTNRDVRLFLPTDALGNVVSHDKAVRLECWASGTERFKRIPETLAASKSGIIHALLKSDADTEFGALPRSVAFGTIGAMQSWLHTLTRDVKADLNAVVIYSTNGAK